MSSPAGAGASGEVFDEDDGLLEPTPAAADRGPGPVHAGPDPGTENNHRDDPGGVGEELCFPDMFTFVEEFLVHVYARNYDPLSSSFRWCEQWWRHPEALSRLDALWHAFEALRLEVGLGPSLWWRDHADPTMAQLTAADGPFAQCKAGREPRHQRPAPLPVAAAPREARG
ncbi:MAG: DUF4913 domain-containing protein [Ornithinimicrobium sp.]